MERVFDPHRRTHTQDSVASGIGAPLAEGEDDADYSMGAHQSTQSSTARIRRAVLLASLGVITPIACRAHESGESDNRQALLELERASIAPPVGAVALVMWLLVVHQSDESGR